MATRSDRSPDSTRGGAYVGLQHYTIHYSSVGTETLTPGMDGIVHCAWEPDAIGQEMAVTVGNPTSIAAVTTSGPYAGTLHVWARA